MQFFKFSMCLIVIAWFVSTVTAGPNTNQIQQIESTQIEQQKEK